MASSPNGLRAFLSGSSLMTHDNKTLLLVDDDPDILEVIRDRLSSLGYTVLTAHDGYEALEIIKRDLLHGVLLDIRMPRLDGLTLLTRLSKDSPELPIIVVTASVEKMKLAELKRAGAIDCVTKPLDYADLLSKIRLHF
jgi:two-component system, NtrC family, response regulator GlrR